MEKFTQKPRQNPGKTPAEGSLPGCRGFSKGEKPPAAYAGAPGRHPGGHDPVANSQPQKETVDLPDRGWRSIGQVAGAVILEMFRKWQARP
jgi:hypothetical protein